MARVKVAPAGHEAGSHRFAKAKDAPIVSKWRSNLTGLSQFRNLYFVAFADQIFVYIPQYPAQKIPSKPAGIIKLQQTRPNTHGYIDRNLPQGINHLIIRELGDEEILLLACDGGDIIGYTIRDIEQAVQYSSESHFLQPQPFFNENVGESGWGLDVHKSERLIAVSSNSHDIHIFAFALASKETSSRTRPLHATVDEQCFNDPANESGKPMVSSRWKQRTKFADCHRRAEFDFAWTLRGHESNIPSITFYNKECRNPQDVGLTSVDINGVVILWSVWDNSTTTHFEFNGHMGWGVCCIDRAITRIVSSKLDAYGCVPIVAGEAEESPYLDITGSVDAVFDSSRVLPRSKPEMEFHTGVTSMLDAAVDLVSLEVEDEDDEEYDAEYDADENGGDEDDMMDLNEDYENGGDSSLPLIDLLDTPIANAEDTAKSTRRRAMESPTSNDKAVRTRWPCNILMAFKSDLVLTSNMATNDAMVWCSDVVHQIYVGRDMTQSGIMTLYNFERLNMIHQIAELGIVLVGSQAGKVSILTMTYYADKNRYGFKIEAVVPFKSQDDENLRPRKLLLGIAAGPIQGYQAKAYSPSTTTSNIPSSFISHDRRYRLMLYYYDHTVLSYEISLDEQGSLLIL